VAAAGDTAWHLERPGNLFVRPLNEDRHADRAHNRLVGLDDTFTSNAGLASDA
jgi:hypothetical protein